MSKIEQIKFQHVNRSRNSVAHELSQHDRRPNTTAVLIWVIPECIVHHVLRDCNSFMFKSIKTLFTHKNAI
jgi:hypothetical protein